jgi:hypothetical protein
MIEGSDVLQDLDQVLSAQLAGSTAGRNELRQSQFAHQALLFRPEPLATGLAAA